MKFDLGFFGVALTLIFIVLKLTHFIEWSWFWVLSPLIFPMIFFIFLILLAWLSKLGQN